MSKVLSPELLWYLGPNFPSTESRLSKAYADQEVWDRYNKIARASEPERGTQLAAFVTYLAAAHTLFPEESQIILNSIE